MPLGNIWYSICLVLTIFVLHASVVVKHVWGHQQTFSTLPGIFFFIWLYNSSRATPVMLCLLKKAKTRYMVGSALWNCYLILP